MNYSLGVTDVRRCEVGYKEMFLHLKNHDVLFYSLALIIVFTTIPLTGVKRKVERNAEPKISSVTFLIN